jgi:hypothetical protein
MSSLEFILGLLDHHSPAFVAAEDFEGEHCKPLQLWQRMGFLSREPERHPAPGCPHCLEGMPILLAGRYRCDTCHSPIDPRHLLLWRFDLGAFLAWLARSLKITCGVRQVDERTWQLGTVTCGDGRYECFFCRGGPLLASGHRRLRAYRNALLFRALPDGERIEGFQGPSVSLLELLRLERGSLRAAPLTHVLHGQNAVRFDAESGALFAGRDFLGEVPVGTKEYFFLACLARSPHRSVPYSDLKQFVLRQAGSRDTTDEATFCHRLRYRLKRRWVPQIDRILVTTAKEKGYRLRAAVITM